MVTLEKRRCSLYRVGHIFHGLLDVVFRDKLSSAMARGRAHCITTRVRRRPWSPSSRFDRRPAKNRREGILMPLPSDGIKTRFHHSIGTPECEPEEEKQVCNFFFCTSTTYKARARVLLQVTIASEYRQRGTYATSFVREFLPLLPLLGAIIVGSIGRRGRRHLSLRFYFFFFFRRGNDCIGG